jgi:hypothetical protein
VPRPASILDGFFTDDPQRILDARRALHTSANEGREGDRREGPEGDRCWGAVTSAQAFDPSRASGVHAQGIFSDVIFGPVAMLRCACGTLRGEWNRDDVCARCGVLCGDPSLRTWRFGRVDTPLLIHPLLFDALDEALARTRGFVESVVAGRLQIGGRSGPAAIALALENHPALHDAACVMQVPLPPPAERLSAAGMSAADAPTAWIGPVNEAWLELVDAARLLFQHQRLNGLVEAAELTRVAQQALERVVHLTVDNPSPQEWTHWGNPDVRHRPSIALADPASDEGGETSFATVENTHDVAAALWLDEESLFIQTVAAVHLLTVAGKTVHRFVSPALRLRSVTSRYVVFQGELNPDRLTLSQQAQRTRRFPGGNDVVIYDMESHAYAQQWPRDMPAFDVCGEPHPPHARHRLAIVDRRTGACIGIPSLLPRAPAAWTGDARFLWVGGAVVEMKTRVPQITGTLVRGDLRGCPAVGRNHRGEWRFISDEGKLSDGAKILAELGPALAYAFSPSCKQIVRVHGSPLTADILDGDGGRVRSFVVPD